MSQRPNARAFIGQTCRGSLLVSYGRCFRDKTAKAGLQGFETTRPSYTFQYKEIIEAAAAISARNAIPAVNNAPTR